MSYVLIEIASDGCGSVTWASEVYGPYDTRKDGETAMAKLWKTRAAHDGLGNIDDGLDFEDEADETRWFEEEYEPPKLEQDMYGRFCYDGRGPMFEVRQLQPPC